MIEVRMRFVESDLEGKLGDFHPWEIAAAVELVRKTPALDENGEASVPDEVWCQLVERDGVVVYEIMISLPS